MNFSISQCHNYRDYRGNLIEFVNEFFLAEKELPFGQIYLVTFEGKNFVRGNHYHQYSSEAFCVIHGEVEFVLEDIETKERFSKALKAGDDIAYRITIGPNIAHALKSVSDLAILASYSSKVYDPEDQDKFPYLLL